MDQDQTRRYLAALSVMCSDNNFENRRFAREALHDMGEPGVGPSDYLRPYMVRPLSELVGPGRRLRLLAINSPLARVEFTGPLLPAQACVALA